MIDMNELILWLLPNKWLSVTQCMMIKTCFDQKICFEKKSFKNIFQKSLFYMYDQFRLRHVIHITEQVRRKLLTKWTQKMYPDTSACAVVPGRRQVIARNKQVALAWSVLVEIISVIWGPWESKLQLLQYNDLCMKSRYAKNSSTREKKYCKQVAGNAWVSSRKRICGFAYRILLKSEDVFCAMS